MNRYKLIPITALALVLILSALAGFYGKLQFLAALTLPLVFVNILHSFFPLYSEGRRHWTLDKSLVVIGSLLTYFSVEFGGEWRYAMLFGGIFILLCGATPSFYNDDVSNKPLSVLGLGASTAIVSIIMPLLILGMNPLTATQYAVIDNFQQYAYSPRGVYIIEKDGLMGLRDRWDTIIEPQFTSMHIMKKTLPFMEVKSANGIGIYNIEKHHYRVEPDSRCEAIVSVGDSIWNMIDKDEVPYRQIILPKFWLDGFEDAQLEIFEMSHSERILIAQKLDKAL